MAQLYHTGEGEHARNLGWTGYFVIALDACKLLWLVRLRAQQVRQDAPFFRRKLPLVTL